MQVPVQITYRGIPSSEALEQVVRDKAAKLEQFHPRLTRCQVVVEQPARHRAQGKEFAVNVALKVPGAEIAANRARHADVYVAVRDAFDAARRQLEDFARAQRGD